MHDTESFTIKIDGKPRRAVIEHEDPRVVAILRAKTPVERAAMADELVREVRRAAEQAVRRAHPDWTDDQISAELIWRYHGVRV